jgi:DUF4097 and DUF4098 domain-containing protein YvlB
MSTSARLTSTAVSSLLLAFLVAAPFGWSQDSNKDFHWKGKLNTDQTVTVKTINGEIKAEPASGDEVEVTGMATGKYAQEVKFEVKQDGDGVTICETYPHHDSCTGKSSGHDNNDRTHISYSVRVPSRNRFTGKSVNGDITAQNLDRQVTAHTVNGGVKISTKSWAEAKSVNGSVEAMMGSADWTGTLHFSTVNGSIHIGLPANTNADVDVRSVNGSFKSELPLATQSFMSRHVEGRIGSGGRELKLDTVNGSVHLVKSN